ncbi:hypothetical protein CP556_21465 [Natrinema sp. CBA1119]|nr:hypothetical protein CP556_21465 [Natrinema sp. CBA1119]
MVLHRDSGYSNTISELHVLDATDGSQEWVADVSSGARFPVADGSMCYVADGSTVRALNLDTGTEEWQYELNQPASVSPVLLDGKLYVTMEDGSGYGTSTTNLIAFDASSGVARWTEAYGDGNARDLVSNGGRLYAVTSNGGVTAFDTSGTVIWTEAGFADTFHHLAIDENRLYVTADNLIAGLSLSDGSRVWDTAVGATASRPVITNAGVFVGRLTTKYTRLIPLMGLLSGVASMMEVSTNQLLWKTGRSSRVLAERSGRIRAGHHLQLRSHRRRQEHGLGAHTTRQRRRTTPQPHHRQAIRERRLTGGKLLRLLQRANRRLTVTGFTSRPITK